MSPHPHPHAPAPGEMQRVARQCIDCNLCRKECAFLQRHGTPGEIARAYDPEDPEHLKLPFECHLCGLCTAVCPVDIDPGKMFLELRRTAASRDPAGCGSDCVYLGYESRGTSRHLSYYAFPTGCDTVFFPGCTFPATRPDTTLEILDYLRKQIPHIGIVLDCCTKPSHDLGRVDYFEAMFGEMRAFLKANHIRKVIVTCPNCFKIFQQYGNGLDIETVYTLLAADNRRAKHRPAQHVTVHDPCVLRFHRPLQQAVRSLLVKSGVVVTEMTHHGPHTFCCGEGASVGCVAPELSETWKARRVSEGAGNPMVTYCAGCTHRLARVYPAVHILDLFFGTRSPWNHSSRRPRFPLTCYNRLQLKTALIQELPAAVVRERTYRPAHVGGGRTFNRNTAAYWISMGVAKMISGYQRLFQR